ncbi:hypothetical protein [Aquibium oceanicum]|uniref:Uncharacterized protein n=1 Tax=Aquibium oceanicum TaxID=1670800 RepID=A0A1L3SQ33_9HYPH|nr:hypothetical protein [Aquibium oceanicum]APH71526.1 hypothetical protein BSQ44_09180 [Aquibium oceanicum]
MQAAMGLALLGLCFLLMRYAKPNAEGIAPPIMQFWGVATAAALLFTVFAGLGILLVVFWTLGIGAGVAPV